MAKLPKLQPKILEFLSVQQPQEQAGRTMFGEDQPDQEAHQKPSVEDRNEKPGSSKEDEKTEMNVEKPEQEVLAAKDHEQANKNEINEQVPTPSGVLNVQQCDVRKDGFYMIHQVQTKKVYVTTKKWKERSKGRGFGYLTCRTENFQ